MWREKSSAMLAALLLGSGMTVLHLVLTLLQVSDDLGETKLASEMTPKTETKGSGQQKQPPATRNRRTGMISSGQLSNSGKHLTVSGVAQSLCMWER
jgi:hypothetical protein